MGSRSTERFDAASEQARLASALVSGTEELADDFDAATLLQSFADLLVRSTPHFPLVWFYIGDPQASQVRPLYCAGAQRAYGESLVIDRSALMRRGPVRRALDSGESVVQSIPARLGPSGWFVPGLRSWHQQALQAGVRSVLALPFPLIEGGDWGLTVVYADHPAYFEETGLAPFDALSRLVRVGLDRVALRDAEQRTRADLERVRLEDPVTELPNQTGFDKHWFNTETQAGHVSLLIQLDLDDFGALNAGLGQETGDTVLREIAGRLRGCVGDQALVGRVGPDEFLVATTVADPADAMAVVEDCQGAVARPLTLGERDLALSATAGFAVGDGDEPPSPAQAGVALRRARGDGPGSARGYAAATDAGAEVPQGLFGELQRAIEHDELTLHYQPQIALEDPATVVGAEALLRWRRPDGDMVPPGAFIPAVEGSAMIRDIGVWVLGETARRLSALGAAGPPVVGVNIGARHLLHARFLEDIDAVLSRYPDLSGRIAVEITETAALSDSEGTTSALAALRDRGFGVALDDFGTGNASFSHLASLPVDQIKIDRQFVDGIDHRPRQLALVESLLVAAQGLGVGVVAEGVETSAEARVLSGLGCRVAQGFLYARPMDPAALVRWLGERVPASEADVPAPVPPLALLQRLGATLRAAEAGAGVSEPPVVPDWFRALFADDRHTAQMLAPVLDHLARCQGSGGQPPPGDAGRRRALAALDQLAARLRQRVAGGRSVSQRVSESADPGRQRR